MKKITFSVKLKIKLKESSVIMQLMIDRTKGNTKSTALLKPINSTEDVSELYTIRNLQNRIHQHVKLLGGYWRTLSAFARLSEEIAEVAEVLDDENIDKNKLGSELADVFMISTCLANQYCADLSAEYSRYLLPKDMREISHSNLPLSEKSTFLKIIACSGTLGRIINSYDGDKKPKTEEKLPSVQKTVAKLHAILFGFANQNGINIFPHILAVLQKSMTRDKGRFSNLYDPTMTSAIDLFSKIKHNTYCPFAKKSRVWGSPTWDSKITIEENLSPAMFNLLRFTRCADSEDLDGFVIAAPGSYGNTIENLSEFTRTVLNYLSDKDPKGGHCMDKDINKQEWQFNFNGEKLFIITFAPCYPKTNSRYSFGEDATFILFQPENSFSKNKVPRGISPGNLRDSIRKEFLVHNQRYFSSIITSNLEAPRYVKPLHVDDCPVKWWEKKPENKVANTYLQNSRLIFTALGAGIGFFNGGVSNAALGALTGYIGESVASKITNYCHGVQNQK